MNEPRKFAGDVVRSGRTSGPREFVAAAYDRFADGLYRYAVMILADRADAEDAVQQAFAKVVRMGERAKKIQSCGDYLRTAVRNECWRMIEGRRRYPERMGMSPPAPMLEAAASRGLDEDERLQIEAAVRALPPEQREVVHLKVYEGKTFQEIADWLGTSINTVASRYRYAMDKLRHLLTCPGDFEGYSHERR